LLLESELWAWLYSADVHQFVINGSWIGVVILWASRWLSFGEKKRRVSQQATLFNLG
jgi:hypothetical protein